MNNIICAAIVFCTIGLTGLSATADTYAIEKQTTMGLTFGQTYEEAQAAGLQATKLETDNSLTTYKVTKLPQQPSSTDVAMVVFDATFGFQKLVWHSKNIEADVSGISGKSQYDSIKTVLEKKYGPPAKILERSGLKLFQEYDEFYQCLAYPGCGYWFSYWEGDFGLTSLGIETQGLRGEGWLKVVYEGPKWATIVDQRESKTEREDAEAF